MATGHKKQAVQAQSSSNPGDVAGAAIMAGQARALPSDVTPKAPFQRHRRRCEGA